MISLGIVSYCLAFKWSNWSIRPACTPSARWLFPQGCRHELYAVHRPDNLRLSFVERMRPVFVSLRCPRRWMRQKKTIPVRLFWIIQRSTRQQGHAAHKCEWCFKLLAEPFPQQISKNWRVSQLTFSYQLMSLACTTRNNSSQAGENKCQPQQPRRTAESSWLSQMPNQQIHQRIWEKHPLLSSFTGTS